MSDPTQEGGRGGGGGGGRGRGGCRSRRRRGRRRGRRKRAQEEGAEEAGVEEEVENAEKTSQRTEQKSCHVKKTFHASVMMLSDCWCLWYAAVWCNTLSHRGIVFPTRVEYILYVPEVCRKYADVIKIKISYFLPFPYGGVKLSAPA